MSIPFQIMRIHLFIMAAAFGTWLLYLLDAIIKKISMKNDEKNLIDTQIW